jgi:DNA-3-methyladenine glycosylase
VTTDATGPGAVLLRAIEPTHGVETMLARRGVTDLSAAASGPAKLFVALGLDPAMTGRVATEVLTFLPRRGEADVAAGPRVGITRAAELPWRFWLRGSPFVSR